MAHPYLVLFGIVLLEQVGLPVPAGLFLVAAGALASAGFVNPAFLAAVALGATLIADLTWFFLGGRYGGNVLSILGWGFGERGLSERTRSSFARQGAGILLWMKFVPGLSAIATPFAGVVKMPLSRFLFFDGAGSAIWSGTYLALGFVFGPELSRFAEPVLGVSRFLLLLVLAGGAIYLTLRTLQRIRERRADAGALVSAAALVTSAPSPAPAGPLTLDPESRAWRACSRRGP